MVMMMLRISYCLITINLTEYGQLWCALVVCTCHISHISEEDEDVMSDIITVCLRNNMRPLVKKLGLRFKLGSDDGRSILPQSKPGREGHAVPHARVSQTIHNYGRRFLWIARLFAVIRVESGTRRVRHMCQI